MPDASLQIHQLLKIHFFNICHYLLTSTFSHKFLLIFQRDSPSITTYHSPRSSGTKLPALGVQPISLSKINNGSSSECFQDMSPKATDDSLSANSREGRMRQYSVSSANNSTTLLEIGHRCSIDNIGNLGTPSIDSDRGSLYVKKNSIIIDNDSSSSSDIALKLLIEKIILRNAEKKEHFIRHVFHEIRTPLHVLSNYLSSFSFPSLEEQREMRHHISK